MSIVKIEGTNLKMLLILSSCNHQPWTPHEGEPEPRVVTHAPPPGKSICRALLLLTGEGGGGFLRTPTQLPIYHNFKCWLVFTLEIM